MGGRVGETMSRPQTIENRIENAFKWWLCDKDRIKALVSCPKTPTVLYGLKDAGTKLCVCERRRMVRKQERNQD